MVTADSPPKAFVSHSHADKPTAEALARALMARGIEAWFDKWEIQAGDSLIQKIFTEGLAQCAVFLVLLSPESVSSKWVREELDVALIQRLEGATRVVPIVVRECTIPPALRALLWIDLAATGVDDTAQKVADVAYGRTAKPPVRNVSRIRNNVDGLSEHAASIAVAIAPALADARSGMFTGAWLCEAVSLDSTQVNDAVDELAGLGLVRLQKALGTHPFDFYALEPTYTLGLRLKGSGAIDYDAEQDIVEVAAAIAALEHLDGAMLEEHVKLPPGRINHAVRFLDDHGHVHVIRALGTAPYDFYQVSATPATRRFVTRHAV